MSEYSLLLGDAVQVMRGLPANSVQCAITSPPYFGLRDYGTATWEGGDAECDHVQTLSLKRDTSGGVGSAGRDKGTRGEQPHSTSSVIQYRDLCGKCGARRIDNQIGLEPTPEAYVAALVEVFREVRRVLHPSGVVWLNLGDTYANFNHAPGGTGLQSRKAMVGIEPHSGTIPANCKPKDLIGIPWMVAFALRADGWYLRSEIIWHKRAPMPESVQDRPTKAHEQVFLLAKNATYFYDAEAIREPQVVSSQDEALKRAGSYGSGYDKWEDKNGFRGNGGLGQNITFNPAGRNKRSVWTLGPESYSGAHFATMPTKLVEPCILAGSKVGDTVLDPFCGSGTTGYVALRHHRRFIGIDLSADYLELAHRRIQQSQPLLFALEVTP